MGNTMSGSIRKFIRDTKGAFAMQFALMAVPLCVCTGLAIDGGRAFLAHYELASALDAAALAAGSTLDEDADLNEVARLFVEKNFKTQHDEPIELDLILSDDDDVLTLQGTVKINTFFMPLVGQPYVEVSAESEVRRGGNHVEVALALDVTGSMNETRMAGLTAASKALIDEVVGTLQTPYFSKVAIVPWAQSIHVDDLHVDASAVTELRGTTIGTTSISAASWRNGSTTTKTISAAGWRTNSGKTITDVSWKNGGSFTISAISKTNSNTRIRVRTTSNHGYSNGDTVYITGANGSYTGLNGNRYKVADRTTTSPYYFWLQNIGTSTYTTPPSGSTNATSGTSQRCYTTTCEVAVTASSHGFATGDFVFIEDVDTTGDGASPNNSWGNTYTVTNLSTNVFILPGTNMNSFAAYDDNGTASECYVSDCRYRVTTTTNHDFSSSDDIFMWGITQSGSGTSLNTSTNSSINVEDPSGTTFFLPGDARNYRTWTSGGSAAECANSSCNVDVTSTAHGLQTDEFVELRSVASGISNTNNDDTPNRAWKVTRLTADTFRLQNSSPSDMSATYASGGTAQCLEYGCAKMIDDDTSNLSAVRFHFPSVCMVERYGDDAATDTAPGTSPLGIYYTNNGTCDTDNYVTPLTPNKTRLNDAIDHLTTGGSTAGQIGIAWAWYMLSPNFASVWDKETVNAPMAYGTPELAKVAILMTDGEFNYTTCEGRSTASAGCSADSPFTQAQAICTAMKAEGSDIIIYTVGLELGTATSTTEFLTNCATSPQHAFLAADTEELKAAFQNIATSISKLRLSK
jgi:hypothetical protein